MERLQKCALSDCIHIRGVEIWIHIDRIASQISSLKCFPITIDCAFFSASWFNMHVIVDSDSNVFSSYFSYFRMYGCIGFAVLL